jgi:hypothetical protein
VIVGGEPSQAGATASVEKEPHNDRLADATLAEASLLVVDDDPASRELLARRLHPAQLATVSISGKATDPSGQPLRQAAVWVESEGRVLRRASTDANGNYGLLVKLPPGEVDICVQSGGPGRARA